MDRITGEMTVREALRFCSPAQQMNLRHWAESFGLKLCEFHIGHIKTYESEVNAKHLCRLLSLRYPRY
jgi:hypothetical protein